MTRQAVLVRITDVSLYFSLSQVVLLAYPPSYPPHTQCFCRISCYPPPYFTYRSVATPLNLLTHYYIFNASFVRTYRLDYILMYYLSHVIAFLSAVKGNRKLRMAFVRVRFSSKSRRVRSKLIDSGMKLKGGGDQTHFTEKNEIISIRGKKTTG